MEGYLRNPAVRDSRIFRTVSLIRHASQAPEIIQRRLTPRAEGVLSETRAWFHKEQSATESIANLRVLNEKATDIGAKIYPNFIDLKRAFDQLRQEALLWHTMRKMKDIGEGITNIIQRLYANLSLKSLLTISTASGSELLLKFGQDACFSLLFLACSLRGLWEKY